MNRMNFESASTIDLRYASMLNKIAAKVNSDNAASLGKSLSLPIVLFRIVIFYMNRQVD